MGLERLMDGAMRTGVLVRADAEVVASQLQQLAEPVSGEGGASPRVLIADLATIDWCRVELTAEVMPSRRAMDSDPLLIEALSAMRDVATPGPIGADTPVRAARLLSRQLGVPAIGIWGSDQGPGIAGAVRFDAGERSWCFSAASPEEIEMIDRIRELEDNERELGEELEAGLDALAAHVPERSWSGSGELAGPVSDHVNKALADLGMNPDWIEEPVWSLSGSIDLGEEVTRVLRIP